MQKGGKRGKRIIKSPSLLFFKKLERGHLGGGAFEPAPINVLDPETGSGKLGTGTGSELKRLQITSDKKSAKTNNLMILGTILYEFSLTNEFLSLR